MKLILASVLVLAIAGPALAQPASATPGMAGMNAGADMVTAEGSGFVTAVDAKSATVTIHHRPIAKLGWPAMTMAFKASPPSLLRGVKVGQPVTFTLMRMNGATTLTAIQAK